MAEPAPSSAAGEFQGFNNFNAPYALPAPTGSALRARGASTMQATVSIAPLSSSALTLEIQLIGAARGAYDVYVLANGLCPAQRLPGDIVSGEVDEDTPVAERRGRSMMRTMPSAGELRVSETGNARLQTALTARELNLTSAEGRAEPEHTVRGVRTRSGQLLSASAQLAVIIEERPGTVNPSLADSAGLVACGIVPLPPPPAIDAAG